MSIITQPELIRSAPEASGPVVVPERAYVGQPKRVIRRALVHRWAPRIAYAAVFLGALELACRVEDWVTYGTPLTSRYTSQVDLMTRDRDGVHGRPHARYQKWVMNGLGMRGPEASVTAPTGVRRIVTAGASETFGLAESPGREYPRQLEDSLTASGSAACGGAPSRAVQVLNAAMPGMSLPTIRQDVAWRIRRLQPSVVVYYPSPAQYLADSAPVAARPDSTGATGTLPAARMLVPRSVARLGHQLKPAIPRAILAWSDARVAARQRAAHAPDWYFGALPRGRVARYERDLRSMVGTIRGIGAEPVFATHANALTVHDQPHRRELLTAWARYYPRANGPMLVEFDSVARDITRRVARDSGVVVTEVASAVASAGPAAFSDFVHFTDLGAARAAGALAPDVRRVLRARLGCAP